MQPVDSIGVVRETPRLKGKGQRARLEADGCRVIVELKKYNRAELELLVRQGTVVKLVHVFLLADPMARTKKGMRADLLATMKRIERRGGIIKDVDSGLDTSTADHRYDVIALATDQLARGGRVSRNGMGRPKLKFSEVQLKQAQDAWESRKLKTWSDVRAKLPKGFTLARAYKLWGKRT